MKLRHGSLFSGIGGFDLAAEWAGWENVFHCEWNPFGQRVLKHYWPKAESFHDITKSDFSKYEHSVDIISGGFPCQPFSTTGKRRGTEDTRYLWPAMLDVIRTVKPRYVVGENVHGLVNWNEGMVFDTVCSDLEAAGYEVRAFLLPAAGVGAIHKRNRIWFVAHGVREYDTNQTTRGMDMGRQKMGNTNNSKELQREGLDNYATYTNSGRLQNQKENEKLARHRLMFNNELLRNHAEAFESALCGENDGLPRELDGITFPKWRDESNKGYGNAIVPQVALQIFNAINEYEDATRGRS